MVGSCVVVLWHKIVLSPPVWFLVEIIDRSFPVTVWTINTDNRFLSIISRVSCSCSVYTDIIHLLNLQMCSCGFVCVMLDLSLTENII